MTYRQIDTDLPSLRFLAELCVTPGLNSSLKELAENILQDELIRVYNLEIIEEETLEGIESELKKVSEQY